MARHIPFPGDNIFHQCRIWLQECVPWEWLVALKEPIVVRTQDPYPLGQRLFPVEERLTGLIVRNLRECIRDRKQHARAA